MQITARISAQLSIEQQADAALAPLASTRGGLSFSGGDTEFTLNGSTTPAVDTKPVDLSQDFGSTSPVSVDLTAAPLAENTGETLDLTGKKLVGVLIAADSGNHVGGVTIGPHATNGYNLFGHTTAIKIYPGETIVRGVNGVASQFPAVGSGAKVVQITPTATGDAVTIKALFA